MKRTLRFLVCVVVSGLLVSGAALAWHAPGHDLATRSAAVLAGQSKELPAFFVAGAKTIAHCSVDSDLFTRPIAPDAMHEAERPEHYFDIDALPDIQLPLPATRYEFLAMLFEKKLKPAQVGLLPYAIVEWADRLTVAFAEHRKWPDDPAIQAKCLVYAGLLSHYAEDLCQPLHTTIHHDGRAKPDGLSPKTGIHQKVDALLGKLRIEPADIAKDLRPAAFDDLMGAVMAEFGRSHALVDRVYELEAAIPALAEPLQPNSKAEKFAFERARAAAQFTASLYVTAWKNSAKIELPDWHHRPPVPPDRMNAASTQAN